MNEDLGSGRGPPPGSPQRGEAGGGLIRSRDWQLVGLLGRAVLAFLGCFQVGSEEQIREAGS